MVQSTSRYRKYVYYIAMINARLPRWWGEWSGRTSACRQRRSWTTSLKNFTRVALSTAKFRWRRSVTCVNAWPSHATALEMKSWMAWKPTNVRSQGLMKTPKVQRIMWIMALCHASLLRWKSKCLILLISSTATSRVKMWFLKEPCRLVQSLRNGDLFSTWINRSKGSRFGLYFCAAMSQHLWRCPRCCKRKASIVWRLCLSLPCRTYYTTGKASLTLRACCLPTLTCSRCQWQISIFAQQRHVVSWQLWSRAWTLPWVFFSTLRMARGALVKAGEERVKEFCKTHQIKLLMPCRNPSKWNSLASRSLADVVKDIEQGSLPKCLDAFFSLTELCYKEALDILRAGNMKYNNGRNGSYESIHFVRILGQVLKLQCQDSAACWRRLCLMGGRCEAPQPWSRWRHQIERSDPEIHQAPCISLRRSSLLPLPSISLTACWPWYRMEKCAPHVLLSEDSALF